MIVTISRFLSDWIALKTVSLVGSQKMMKSVLEVSSNRFVCKTG